MSKTYSDEQVIKLLKAKKVSYKEACNLCREPYSEEVFLTGLNENIFSLYMIPREHITEAIALKGLDDKPWLYDRIETPTYPVSLKAVELCPSNLSKVPKDQRTEELCDVAIEASIQHRKKQQRAAVCKMSNLPKPLRTPERLLKMISFDGTVITELISQGMATDELIIQAIQQNPKVFRKLDIDTLNPSVISKALAADGGLLANIPKEKWTDELINIALTSSNEAIRCLGELTPEQAEIVLEHQPFAIRNISQDLPLSFLKRALQKSYWCFNHEKYTKHRVLTPYYTKALIEQTNLSRTEFNMSQILNQQDEDIKKELLPILAKELSYLEQTMSFEEFLIALSSPYKEASLYFRYLETTQTRDLRFKSPSLKQLISTITKDKPHPQEHDQLKMKDRVKLVKEDGLNLKEIAFEKQTQRLVNLALQQNPAALKFVHPNLKDYRSCRYAVQRDHEMAFFSPYHIETTFRLEEGETH